MSRDGETIQICCYITVYKHPAMLRNGDTTDRSRYVTTRPVFNIDGWMFVMVAGEADSSLPRIMHTYKALINQRHPFSCSRLGRQITMKTRTITIVTHVPNTALHVFVYSWCQH